MKHQLVKGKEGVHTARCGHSSEERTEFTGWQSQVTCPDCLRGTEERRNDKAKI